jgi:hypothetical protein
MTNLHGLHMFWIHWCVHSHPGCALIMFVVLWLTYGEGINVCECITVVTLRLHFQNLLHESTDTFFFLNVKFDNVRSKPVNLHACDKLWQSVHLQLHRSQHMFVRNRKQSPVQVQRTLSCFWVQNLSRRVEWNMLLASYDHTEKLRHIWMVETAWMSAVDTLRVA